MSVVALLLVGFPGWPPCASADEPLPGTRLLPPQEDFADLQIAGIDRFLLRQIQAASAQRERYWAKAMSAPDGLRRMRAELREMLGMTESVPLTVGAQTSEAAPQQASQLAPQPGGLQYLGGPDQSSQVGEGPSFKVHRVGWRVDEGVDAEGILLEPTGEVRALVVAVPDASQTAEDTARSDAATALATGGARVLVPAIVQRTVNRRRNAELTDREFLHRSAFELGRLLNGYELQQCASALAAFKRSHPDLPTAIIGWGEGGRLALLAAATTPGWQAAVVSGYFGPRDRIWEEPLDRNVFGLLSRFADAELAGAAQAKHLIIDDVPGPVAKVRTRGGAPYQLENHASDLVRNEFQRAQRLEGRSTKLYWIDRAQAETDGVSRQAVRKLAMLLKLSLGDASSAAALPILPQDESRQQRLVARIDRHNQRQLADSAARRRAFWKGQDTGSLPAFEASMRPYRQHFRDRTIGHFDFPLLPPAARTRQLQRTEKWTAYEVQLDVFPDVFAYGILLMPHDIPSGERRPVVVCQHGLEGRPKDTIWGDSKSYHDYAARLAERGFVTFAPQNIYIFGDRFRTLQRKANAIGRSLFSVMVPQHQQITRWLGGLAQVDAKRIAFYGLSYGGKSAMRIPPLVPEYCLSICSADFNDWVKKNASTRSRYSYVWTGEYEIFEWNLGGTFNYAEMAALIAPRPFMVERGHFDGVAADEDVAAEFAKVRHLYQAQLGIGDRCQIEFFVGPHTIHGQGTFDFLHRHLQWPPPSTDADNRGTR